MLRLAIDGEGARPPVLVRDLEMPVEHRPGGSPDRGQRCPQVVGDRLEEGGLQRVALAGDLGQLGLLGQPVLLERLADLVGRSGEQACLRPAGLPGTPCPEAPDRADRPPGGLDDDPMGAHAGAVRSDGHPVDGP